MFRSKALRALSKKERVLLSLILVIFFFLIVADLIHDIAIEPSFVHLLFEGPIMLMGLIGISFLLYKLNGERTDREKIEEKVVELRSDLHRIQKHSQKFLHEFYESVMDQFNFWGLTPSEKEIGLLLLKGLSFKEIAAIRHTSERTIRNQAISIYNRSGQSSRSEFAAFFLKDMILTPQEIEAMKSNDNQISRW